MKVVEVSKVLLLLFFLISQSQSDCGSFDVEGKIYKSIKEISLNGHYIKESNLKYDFFECNSKRCSFALYDSDLKEIEGCDSDKEFIQIVKKVYGRDVQLDSNKSKYLFGNISKKLQLKSFYVGCDFLRIDSILTLDTVSAFFLPQKNGVCPIKIKFDSYDIIKNKSNPFVDDIYLVYSTKKNNKWNIKLEALNKSNISLVDDESEFVFTEKPIDLFIEPCKNNLCSFFSTESMPFLYGVNKDEKYFVIKNINRIKTTCDFLKIEKSIQKEYTGNFEVNGTGDCSILITTKNNDTSNVVKRINVLVKKSSNDYLILLGK